MLSVIGFDSEDDAVRIANDSDYGLPGAVWTSDIGHAHGVARGIRAGSVSVNVYNGDGPEMSVPFGG